jgi:hypothetical protein
MRRPWILLLLLIPQLALADSVTLLWQFLRDFDPAPDRFLITLTRPESHDTLAVTPSLPGACGTGDDSTTDTYCATLPDCPANGIYELKVEAEWDELGRSEPSANVVQCVFSRELPCQCFPYQGPHLTGRPEETAELTPQPADPPAREPEPPPIRPTPPPPRTPVMPTFPALPARAAPS